MTLTDRIVKARALAVRGDHAAARDALYRVEEDARSGIDGEQLRRAWTRLEELEGFEG